MINKSFTEITISDIQSLIDNKVSEGKTIEYKSSINLKTDSDKKEFLADISSFANASGGDLLIGVSENRSTGLPESLVGIENQNIDQLILQIENLIRDGVEPRINNIQLQKLQLQNKNYLLLIRIPKSWRAPHQVTLQNTDKFYSRGNNGKYRLDVEELRAAFLVGEAMTEKIRKFVANRISNIVANEAPLPLPSTGKIVLHLIPANSFIPGKRIELLDSSDIKNKLRPLAGGSRTPRFNLEGIISSSWRDKDSYVQLYRNGIIETVNSNLLAPYSDNKIITVGGSSYNYEVLTVEIMQEYLEIYKQLNEEVPVFLFLTLVNVKDYILHSDRWRPMYDRQKIDKDVFQVGEVVINSFEEDIPRLLKPLFDTVWNAGGYAQSENYDNQGNWKPV